ncbi:MAG: polysaccharide biosynthesis C-terminal domain-containing protein [Bacteroidia bacterium]
MLRKFIADIAFIQMLNLLVKPVWILIIDRAVQNQLSQQAYGEYFALFNFSLLFFIVLDLGITSFNATQISKRPKKLKQMFGNLFGLKLLLTLLYLFLVISFGSVMGYNSSAFGLLLLVSVVQILTSFNQYFRSSISAFQMFKSDGVFMVLDRLIIIGLCAVLLWGGIAGWSMTIERFIWAQIIGLFTVSLLLLLFIFIKVERVRLSFNLKKVFPLLKKTWPYGLLITLMGLYNYLDGVMIEQLSLGRAEDAAVYAMGYRLYFALFMFAQVFSTVLLAMYGKHEKSRASIRLLSSFSAKLLLIVSVSIALFTWVYQTEIIQILYPEKFSVEASSALSLLMIGFIGSSLILVYGTLLTSKEKLKQLNWAAAITLVLNVSLNYTLIPKHGPAGAAIATMCSQLVFGICCWLISYKLLGFITQTKNVIILASGMIILFLGIVVSKQYIENTTVHLVMITLTILITAYLYKLFDAKSLNSGS